MPTRKPNLIWVYNSWRCNAKKYVEENPQFTTKTTVIATNPQYRQGKVDDGEAVDLTAAVSEHYAKK